MFSFRMRVNTFQAPFLYMTLSRLLPLIFHFTNFYIIKGKCYFRFVSPFFLTQFSFAFGRFLPTRNLKYKGSLSYSKRKAYVIPCKSN